MKESIVAALTTDFPWRDQIVYFDSLDSTNTKAKELAAQGAPHGTIVIANSQSAGRGRMGRSFHSPAGTGIYLSVVLRPQCPAIQLMHLTCAAAVAACDAIETATGIRPGIKWTNDLVYNARKLGGILTELSLDSQGNVAYAVIGIGVNCCQVESDFPEELQNLATSLRIITGKAVNTSRIAASIISSYSAMADSLMVNKVAVMDRYRADCITVGREISLVKGDTVRHALAEGVDNEGALLVRFPDGHREAINAGEVSIRGMYGYVN